jgi:hypothetical protein
MEKIISWVSENKDLVRPIWFILGTTGLWIMYRFTRSSFYENRSPSWWVACLFMTIFLGPLYFLISLVTLINPDKKEHKKLNGR